MKHFRFRQSEIDSLSDDQFYDIAAKAYFLEKKVAENIKTGILLALEKVFEK